MDVEIRSWRRPDLKHIQRGWIAFCRQATRSDMKLKPRLEHAMMEWLRERFEESSAFGLIAEREGAVAGFLTGRVGEWDSVPPVIEPRKLGIIDAVYVDEAFRRQGIASRLIEHAVQMLRERNVIAVETIYDAGNDASAETWRCAGFLPWMVHGFRLL